MSTPSQQKEPKDAGSGPQPEPPDNAGIDEAVQRVTLYLRAAGLEKATNLTQLATTLVERVRASTISEDANDTQALAIEAAMVDFERWLDEVLQSCDVPPDDAEARGLVMWQLPALLEGSHESVPWHGPPPEALRARIRARLTPVAPVATPGQMRPQEFGEMPPPLRARFWRRIRRRLTLWWGSFTGTLTGR